MKARYKSLLLSLLILGGGASLRADEVVFSNESEDHPFQEFPCAAESYPSTNVIFKITCSIDLTTEEIVAASNNYVKIVNDKQYIIGEGGDVKVGGLQFGNKGQSTQHFTIDGGKVEITGSAEPTSNMASILLGHWKGSSRWFNVFNGSLVATNAITRLGWDGGCTFVIGTNKVDGVATNGFADLKGITSGGNGHSGAGTVTINPSGILAIGDGGINFSNDTTATLAGGILRMNETASISISHSSGLQITAPSIIEIAGGKTTTISCKLTGSGSITVKRTEGTSGDATLKLNGTLSSFTGDLILEGNVKVVLSKAVAFDWPSDGLKVKGRTASNITNDLTIDGLDSSILADIWDIENCEGEENACFIKSAKVKKPFFHYSFDGNDATESVARASDSLAYANSFGEAYANAPLTKAPNGKAVTLCGNGDNKYQPYWDGNSLGLSPLHTGAATITVVMKPVFTDKRVVWSLGQNSGTNTGFALAVKDENSIALFQWTGSDSATELLSVTNINNLTNNYHFVAVVVNASGTQLIVDDQKETTATKLPTPNQRGQIGAIHGGVGKISGYSNQGDAGCFIDDWQVYNYALTDEELSLLRRKLHPTGFLIYFR